MRRQRHRHVAQLDESLDTLEALVELGGVRLVLREARLVAVELVVQLPEHLHLQLHARRRRLVQRLLARRRRLPLLVQLLHRMESGGPHVLHTRHQLTELAVQPASPVPAFGLIIGAVRRAPQAFNSFQPSLSLYEYS